MELNTTQKIHHRHNPIQEYSLMNNQLSDALHLDLYELTMSQAMWRQGITNRTATFSLFFRGYPTNRNFYIATGIDQALQFLQSFRFTDADIQYLKSSNKLSPEFIDYLASISFSGNARAVPEGTIVFSNEPLLEVTAPLIEAQIVETMLLTIISTASLLATKAARIVKAAQNKPVFDFSSRRAHGTYAGLEAARSSYIAGFQGTSNLKAAAIYDIPAIGTMAHSYVLTFGNELEAFRAYAKEFPASATLLVDTYNTIEGIKNAITVGKEMKEQGQNLNAIRIDSGDLAKLSLQARHMLDDAGLYDIRIIGSGGLDEFSIHNLTSQKTAIDAFGVGTRFGTSADAPYIDSLYKLVELNSQPIFKRSEGKTTIPWAKQVYRRYTENQMAEDMISRADSPPPSEKDWQPLLQKAMANGKITQTTQQINSARTRVAQQIAALPERYQSLQNPDTFPVQINENITLK